MSALVWGVKASLLAYVRGMPDGRVEASGGATETPDGFAFPAHGEERGGVLGFHGSVTLTGHGGMMRVVLADPRLVPAAPGWELTVRDDEDPSGRLRFATVEAFEPDDGGVRRAAGTRLTAEGADLFFGPYTEGTPLDDPRVEP
ncbi:hypothetical protein GCM10009809_15230 [Isoptericola hypogeus]|uniref:Htaa domain-containing protein n=1 Tax=Isoptericola hypogeus TaxID=300179 RepID=A0ABN2J974_9MICO